jgi:type IV pilus assembly protein PilB
MGDVLKEFGYISDDEISQVLDYQKTDEGKNKRLGELLIELGFVTEQQVIQALGKKLEYPIINLDDYEVKIDVVSRLPKQIADKYTVIAVSEEKERLQLVVSDPLNFYAQEDIRQIVDMPLEIYLATSEQIKKAIDYYYSEIAAKSSVDAANDSIEGLEELDTVIDDVDDDVPVIKLINSLLIRGYSTNTSDIHIEPFEKATRVRMRIDGSLVNYTTIQKNLHNSIVARIKIMSNMDIAEKRIPQDGNFRIFLEGHDISMRVNVLPTVHGEKVCMRYLTSDTVIDSAGNFGMTDDAYKKIMKMISAPNGIVYITGPTGSGKTTTLYMILDYLARRPVNVSTVEDPVERNLPNINQTSINAAAGMTFGVGLRALLRQDPDIIMLGETRDAETAQISARAAITGHLVVSTLHTNDAVSSIVRLEDMGLEPYMVASSVVGIVAQRLVRKVCQACKYECEPTEDEKRIIGNDIPKIWKGKGCKVCNNTGYKGRRSIHEMVLIDKKLKRMIADGADNDSMYDYAVNEQGMKTLYQAALDLVREGVTTPDEVLKVSYNND